MIIVMEDKIKTTLSLLSEILQDGEFFDRVFLVGGSVRDMQLGLAPKDIDLVVTGDINSGIDFANYLAKKLGIHRDNSNPVVFPTYGTAKVQLNGVKHQDVDLNDVEIECVATRKEEYSGSSRKPKVFHADLMEDVLRRDFTVNSLLVNLTTNEILDLTGRGIKDIQEGVIATTNDSDFIFSDDPLRMLRAIRFAFKFGWRIEDSILESIKQNASKIKNISQERIRDELNKILVGNNVKKAFNLMRELGLLIHFLPELSDCYEVDQGIHHDKCVFNHILDVVEVSPAALEIRLMALFHDIGKPVAKSIDEGKIHFYKHDAIGAEMAEKIMRRLKYSNDVTAKVKLAVFNHMRLKRSGKNGSKFSDKALRKFSMDVGDQLENVLDLMHSDNISHSIESSLPDQIPNLRKRFETLYYPVKDDRPNIPIDGNDLIELGLKPSKLFKELLNLIVDKWLENPNITKNEALKIIKEKIGK